jgi:hypothetical protein
MYWWGIRSKPYLVLPCCMLAPVHSWYHSHENTVVYCLDMDVFLSMYNTMMHCYHYKLTVKQRKIYSSCIYLSQAFTCIWEKTFRYHTW